MCPVSYDDNDDIQIRGPSGDIATVTASNALKTDGSAVTQPVSAASLPLPAGAATSANQTTANASLASIDAGIPVALGQTTMANSMPVVLASNQASIPVTATISGSATEAELATFTLQANGIASANLKSMVSLLNATGTVVKIKIREIRVVNTQNTAVTGVIADFNFYRMTGHSAGTLITPLAYDTTDILNVNVTARTGATIAGEAAVSIMHVDMSTDEWGPGAADVESNAHEMQKQNPVYICRPKMKPITLNSAEGIHLKCMTNTTTGLLDIQILFTQE
jgi:hypothetical protein